jgi:signal peptidase
MTAEPDSTDLSKSELAAEVVRSFGELRLRVTGSSMLPAIRPDDVLTVRHCGVDEVGVGDVVLYTRHRRLFAHRVVSRSDVGLVTQGDGVAKPDPAVTAAEFLGRIVLVSRRGRSIPPESKPTSPGRIAAALVRRSAGAGRLLIRLQGLQHRAGL